MKVDIYFDTICPWCWIGKHNLDRVLEIWDGEKIEVTYNPFFLDETIPLEGLPAENLLQKKYNMTNEQTQSYLNRLINYGKEVGVAFNYD